MVKGYYPALLLLFGMKTESVLMKTIFKDLTSDEALETLNTSLKLIDLMKEDPSFLTITIWMFYIDKTNKIFKLFFILTGQSVIV